MNLFLTSIWLCFTTWIAYYIAQSCQSTHLFLAAFVGLVAGLLVRFGLSAEGVSDMTDGFDFGDFSSDD